SWDRPLKEFCPVCGAFLIERKDKASGEQVKLCIMCDVKNNIQTASAEHPEENKEGENVKTADQ
ncbi:MAG: hypothetical protein LBD99_02635, partial [Candidatus Margulisbacteria bacterium]|nr:hypothetical protein [Candidatus Margulisiibacteriota bacterium]